MPFIKKLCSLVIAALSLSACATTYANESELMTNRLLFINSDRFIIKTEGGESSYDSLLEYKEWEKLYIKYSKYDEKEKTLTEIEMKKLLFIGYIARTNLDAAISQSFASDLVPIFNNNPETMLNVLSKLKFLIPSTCYYLNRYFGFEGKHLNEKEDFIKTIKPMILRKLGDADGTLCLEQLM